MFTLCTSGESELVRKMNENDFNARMLNYKLLLQIDYSMSSRLLWDSQIVYPAAALQSLQSWDYWLAPVSFLIIQLLYELRSFDP